MSPKRVIAKSRRSTQFDFLSNLPSDLTVQIIDQLREDDLRRIPLVCKSWAHIFSSRSPTEHSFGAIVRKRFGLSVIPPHISPVSWGKLYLTFRRERCHLCPRRDVAPFVYAGSTTLSVLLLHHPTAQVSTNSLTLFPVCNRCFKQLLHSSTDSFMPVVEPAAVKFIFPHVTSAVQALPVDTGFLYSDIPGFRNHDRRKGVEYVLARPLLQPHQ